MPYKFICNICGQERVFRDENSFAGRKPLGMAEESRRRHERKHGEESGKIINGTWDSWSKEFIPDDS